MVRGKYGISRWRGRGRTVRAGVFLGFVYYCLTGVCGWFDWYLIKNVWVGLWGFKMGGLDGGWTGLGLGGL